MTSATVGIRRAEAADLAYVERVLSRNDLPADDVRSGPATFYVATAGGDRVGVGGFERYGADALLRSVAIEAAARGNGYGSALVDELEATAAAEGVTTIYLLTTTAAAFFADRGYERTDRDDAPAAIRNSTEFAELCPSSATCMRNAL